MPQPNIDVFLNGLQVVFTDPKNETCSVGVLRNAPAGHTFSIEVQRPNGDGDLETFRTIDQTKVKDQLEIMVSNTSSTGISRRKMGAQIDRQKGPSGPPPEGDADSFQWLVDFEGREMYDQEIGAKREGFVSILTTNNGELFTQSISQNHLIIKKGPEDPGTRLGLVATITGLAITLDQPNSRAVFKNGDEVIFEADPRSRYRLLINRVCSGNAGSDADSYYNAVGDKLPSRRNKLLFDATPLPPGSVSGPNDPDARCMNMCMSRSRP